MITDKTWVRLKEVDKLFNDKKIGSEWEMLLNLIILIENIEETENIKVTYESLK
jgi:hypothetical protein